MQIGSNKCPIDISSLITTPTTVFLLLHLVMWGTPPLYIASLKPSRPFRNAPDTILRSIFNSKCTHLYGC